MFDIEKELKKLPAKPGVYIMHDKNDKIIYVGKAISLKNRVRQYFRKNNKTKRFSNIEKNFTSFFILYYRRRRKQRTYCRRLKLI